MLRGGGRGGATRRCNGGSSVLVSGRKGELDLEVLDARDESGGVVVRPAGDGGRGGGGG